MKNLDRFLGAVTFILAVLAIIGLISQTKMDLVGFLIGALMMYCGARLFVRAK